MAVMGCDDGGGDSGCGGGGTSGSGHRATVGLRSLGSGRGCRELGHGKGEAHGSGMAHGKGVGHRRAQSRGGSGEKNERNEKRQGC